MAENSKIEWTDATWNPWYGCLKISPGCKFCYMYRDMERYGRDPRVVTRSKTKFKDPLKWVKSGNPPKFCFTCSWSDFFIDSADAWRPEAWEIIRKTPQITYQILTKRPELIRDRLPVDWGNGYANVWLGVSAENQEYADERIPLLLQTPAAVRWISAEPLLGPVDLSMIDWNGSTALTVLEGYSRVNWVVAGGESGPNARPMHPEWARSLRDQCKAAGVPFFFKQWGEWLPYGEGEPITHIQDAGKRLWFVGNKSHAQENRLVPHPVEGGTVGNPEVPHFHSRHTAEVFKVGKKAAGRKLDGVEHNEYPVSAGAAAGGESRA